MVEPSDAVQIWLWIGTIGMALGALAFLFMAAREKPGHRWFQTITFFIVAIAGVDPLPEARVPVLNLDDAAAIARFVRRHTGLD